MPLVGRVTSNRLIQPKKPKAPSLSRVFAPSWGRPTGAPSAPSYSPTQSGAASIGTDRPNIPESDPRDAGYFQDVAKLDQYYQSNRASLTEAQQGLARNLAKNQGLLQEQQPKDELGAKVGANKAGLFYSGALGKNLGDIATSYARRRSDLQTDYESDTGKINRQLQDLESNYGPSGLMRNDALLAGIGRASAADQANALSYVPQDAAPAAAASIPFRTEPGTSKAGVPGTWHIYPGGRRVFVARH